MHNISPPSNERLFNEACSWLEFPRLLRNAADVEHFEVHSSYLGLRISTEVFRIIARQLSKNQLRLTSR